MVKDSHLTDEEKWRITLVEGHQALVRGRSLFRHIPSAPRCKICANPFGGLGGKLFALAGWRPSRQNPNLCERCCTSLPEGGAEVDTAVLFGDVRGSTALGDTVNIAARLQSHAMGGEVVLSVDAYDTAGTDVPQGELRSVELKGRSEPLAVRVVRA